MTQPSARFTLITAARLLDGTGSAAVEQAALLIDGDRVADLGRASHVHVADGEAAVGAEVRKLLKEGADYIKIVASGGSTRTSDPNRASYTVAELAAMTDEAHRHGKLTAAHCTSAQSVQNCLDADVDMVIHCIFNEPDGTYRFRPDLVARLAAARAWVNPTLYVMKAGIERQREVREREGRLTPELTAQLA